MKLPLITTLLLAGACSCMQPPYKGGLAYNPRVIEVANSTGAVYNLSHAEAERQLYKLAETAETEGAWFYIELKGGAYLLDVGIGSGDRSVSIVSTAITELQPRAKVTAYHIHHNRVNVEARDDNKISNCQLPSIGDYNTHMILKYFGKNHGVEITPSRIISRKGITEFDGRDDAYSDALTTIYKFKDSLSPKDLITAMSREGLIVRFEELEDSGDAAKGLKEK